MMPDLGPLIRFGFWAILCVAAALVTALIATLIGAFTTLSFGVICFLFIQVVLMALATVFVVVMK